MTAHIEDHAASRPLRILVMDDEEIIRTFLECVFTSRGDQVTLAPDGDTAIAAYLAAIQRGQRYDLAVLDLTIHGGKGGDKVIAELRRHDPAVRAIASSGYANDPIMVDFARHGFAGRLAKPYRIAELVALVTTLTQ